MHSGRGGFSRPIQAALACALLLATLLSSINSVSAAPFCKFTTPSDNTADDFRLILSPFGLNAGTVVVYYQIDDSEFNIYQRYFEGEVPFEGPAIPITPGQHTITIRCAGNGVGEYSDTVFVEGGIIPGGGGTGAVGIIGILLGLLAIALGWGSFKKARAPSQVIQAEPDVDLDKKVPLLKTDKEAQEQQRFFDEQRTYGEPKAGSRAYLSKFYEVPHRLMDDPLTKETIGPYLKLMDSGLHIINSTMIALNPAFNKINVNMGEKMPKVKYDPEADKYFYDFQDPVTGKEAISDFLESSAHAIMHEAPKHAFNEIGRLDNYVLDKIIGPKPPHFYPFEDVVPLKFVPKLGASM